MHRIPWRLAAALFVAGRRGVPARFSLKNFTSNEALYRASIDRVPASTMGQRGHGVREADYRPLRSRFAAAAILLVSGVGARTSGRVSCSRRRASTVWSNPSPTIRWPMTPRSSRPAHISKTLAEAAARPDLWSDGDRVVQHADRPVSQLAADPGRAERDRRPRELAGDQGLRGRRCSISAGKVLRLAASSTSRTCSPKYATTPAARRCRASARGVVQVRSIP